MMEIDCSELSSDEKLALAGKISDELSGKALALVRPGSIVIDQLSPRPVPASQVLQIVRAFALSKKQGVFYRVEAEGDSIVLHSADPAAAAEGKRDNELPPNVKQCPYCPFVTPNDVEYQLHLRSHLLLGV